MWELDVVVPTCHPSVREGKREKEGRKEDIKWACAHTRNDASIMGSEEGRP